MTTITNSFEEGTSGTTITTGNSGGSGSTAFDAVSIGTAATVAFSNTQAAHGALSALITEGSGGLAYVQWSAAIGTQPQLYGRAYVYLTTAPAPASTTSVFWYLNGATTLARIQMTSARKLVIANTSGSIVATFATTTPLNQWVRVEWNFTFPASATGRADVRLYLTPDSTLPSEEQIVTVQDFGSLSANTARFGWNGTGSASFYLDDIGLSTTGWLGPSGAESRRAVSIVPSLVAAGVI